MRGGAGSRKKERGTAALELVLVFPLYMLLLLALVAAADLGMISTAAHLMSRTQAWSQTKAAPDNAWSTAFGHFSPRAKEGSSAPTLTVMRYPVAGVSSPPPSVTKAEAVGFPPTGTAVMSGAHSLPGLYASGAGLAGPATNDRLYGSKGPLSSAKITGFMAAPGRAANLNYNGTEFGAATLRLAAVALDGDALHAANGFSAMTWMQRHYASLGTDYTPPVGGGVGKQPIVSRHTVLRGALASNHLYRPYASRLAEDQDADYGRMRAGLSGLLAKPGGAHSYWDNEYHQYILVSQLRTLLSAAIATGDARRSVDLGSITLEPEPEEPFDPDDLPDIGLDVDMDATIVDMINSLMSVKSIMYQMPGGARQFRQMATAMVESIWPDASPEEKNRLIEQMCG